MTNNIDIDIQKTEHTEHKASDEHQDAPQKQNPIAELIIPPTIINEYRTNNEDQKRKDTKRFRVEVATLIVISVYTAIAAYQGCQMRKATKAAENSANAAQIAANTSIKVANIAERNIKAAQEQFRLEQRAWINIVKAKYAEPLIANKISQIEITVINSGKTPALNVCRTQKMWVEEPGGKVIMGVKADLKPKITIGTNIERTFAFVGYNPTEQRMIDLINSGKVILFVELEVTYFDVFTKNKTHHTRTCFHYDPKIDKFSFGDQCSYMD